MYSNQYPYQPSYRGMPDTTVYPAYGATSGEILAQNIAIAEQTGANKPGTLAPFKPEAGQQYWVRELDGSWSLRTCNDCMNELQPGKWVQGANGATWFVREPK